MTLRLIEAHEAQRRQYFDLGAVGAIVESSQRDEAELSIRLRVRNSLALDVELAKWGAAALGTLGLLVCTVLAFRIALEWDTTLTPLLTAFSVTIALWGMWLLLETISEDLGLS